MGAAVDEMGQDEKMKYFGKMTQYKTYAKVRISQIKVVFEKSKVQVQDSDSIFH